MPEDATTCPTCGEVSHDAQWCDHCGARLQEAGAGAAQWLENGQRIELLDAAERRLTTVVEAAVDTFATRRVLFGRIAAGPDELVDTRVLIEEREDEEQSTAEIPEEVKDLFRTPLATGRHGDHPVRIYEDTGALTLEDLVDLAGGELSYNQIKECFTAIMDSVISAHRARHLILAIAPWTVRLENATFDQLDHEMFSSETLDGFDDGDVTVESRLPDKKVLEEASAAAEAEIERERSESETSESEESEESEANSADTKELDPDFAEESIDLIEEEEDVGLSGRTLPSYDSPTPEDDGISAAEGDETRGEPDDIVEGDDAEIGLLAEQTGDPVEELEADVDDAWGAMEDSEDALGETGVLHGGAASNTQPDAKAFFEGIDELFPFDEEPYEVPVIMGFSPPELLGRVRADLGAHCDVFALGMLLYYMICGRVPPASVYTRYTPALPSRNFRPGFPPGLQSIVSRATRPSPDDRFASVQAMRDAFLSACSLMERRAKQTGGVDAPRAVIAVDTHVGIAKAKRNPTNQDSVFARATDDGRFAVIVVADGVSTASYGSGDLASHHLTDAAAEVWADVLPKYLMEERVEEVSVIGQILDEANERIVAHVNENFSPFDGNPHEVMGTTALVCVIRSGIVTLASLGDSRAYLQTSSGLEQITADHNLWTLSVLDGISADAALSMPHGDALARCLGTFVIENRQLTPVRPEADFFRFSITRGDTLLLTTDGLIDFAGANPFAAEENVLTVMLAEPDPALACLELILLANRGGGGDNVGVGIAHFV